LTGKISDKDYAAGVVRVAANVGGFKLLMITEVRFFVW